MTIAPTETRDTQIDAAYRTQRLRLRSVVAAQVASAWAQLYRDREAAITYAVNVVQAGQAQTVSLVAAYMTVKALQETGQRISVGLDPAAYTIEALRKIEAPRVYARPYGALGVRLNEGATFDDAVTSAVASVTKLATTDLQLAQTNAARDWMQGSADRLAESDIRVVGYRRVLSGPGPHCALCTAASTRTYRIADLLPIHEHCVTGETLVAAAVAGDRGERGGLSGGHGPIRKVTRRWYRGEIIVIRTAAGHELTVTPNHPILTPQGWVPAGLLDEGHHVLSSSSGERVVGRVPHEDEVPALIQDRFAAARVGGLVRVPFAAEDFHGDRGDGEVDVVAADRELWNRIEAGIDEPLLERALAVGSEPSVALTGSGGLGEMLVGSRPAAHGGMGGGRELATLLRAEGSHPGTRSLAEAAALDPSLVECAADYRAAHAEGLCERHSRFAREVSACKLATVDVDAVSARTLGYADAAAADLRADDVLADAGNGRSLTDRLAGQVQADRVVELRRIDWSGHVFNLHTVEGWYSANSIITHNCTCTVQPLFGTEPVASVGTTVRVDLDPELGPRLMADEWSPVGPRLHPEGTE